MKGKGALSPNPFYLMYYTPVDDALVVSIRLVFGDSESPQPRL